MISSYTRHILLTFGWLVLISATVSAQLVINEFMADNENGLVDGNGDRSDWIEIYNPTAGSVDLEGWFLSDDPADPARWAFPDWTIGGGDFLIVIASGQAEVLSSEAAFIDSLGYPHANFRLNSSGENVLLVRPDGETIEDAHLDFPVQSPDVSFGLLPDGGGSVPLEAGASVYFSNPTPGEANDASDAGLANEVIFSVSSRTFNSSIELELTTDLPSGEIRYTLNGSVPTGSSTRFQSPITIDSSTQVRARVFLDGVKPGPVVGESYIKLRPALQDFSSNLPLVIAENFDGPTLGDEVFRDFVTFIFEPTEESGRSALQNVPDVATRMGFRIRGQSSQDFEKRQYRLETRDQNDNDRDLPLLGMPEESDWVLNGPWVDKSLIRNPLAFDLGNEIGVLAPRTRHCEFFLNTNGGDLNENDYIGVYFLLENIKRGPNRVPVPVLEENDTEAPDITGGYIIRFEEGVSNRRLDGWVSLELLDSEEYTLSQWRYISDYVDDFDDALPDGDFRSFIDVDSFINNIVISELIRDQDSYVNSAYLYKDREGPLFQGPLWDFNLSMGTGGSFQNLSTSGWQFDVDANDYFFSIGEREWNDRLFEDADFSQRLIDRYHELRQGTLSIDQLFARIDSFADPLQEAQERNFERWPDLLGDPDPGFVSPASDTWEEQIEFLKEEWFRPRIEWMDGRFLDPPSIDSLGGLPFDRGGLISMSAPRGNIYYTTDGSDPRAPGGAIQGTLFSAPFKPEKNAIVRARAHDPFFFAGSSSLNQVKWSPPATRTIIVSPVFSKLRITEIMYHPPDPPLGDPEAEFIELTNVGNEALDLNLLQLSGGVEFVFPDMPLAFGQSIVMVRNVDAFGTQYPDFDGVMAGEYSGNLSNGGERIVLEIIDGEAILDFEYSDTWFAETDGEGFSLSFIDPVNSPASGWGEMENWKPSAVLLGTPGENDLRLRTGAGDWYLYY